MANNMNFNPFADCMKAFSDKNMWNNMFHQPSKAQPSMMDVNGMMAMQKRNLEAVSSMNQMMAENVQSLMRRQAEAVQSSASEAFQMVKEMAVSSNPEICVNKQANFAKSSLENVVAHAREMAEMVAKSNFEVFDMLGKRMADAMGECNGLSSPVVASSGKKKAA